jgi:hypothetical protein
MTATKSILLKDLMPRNGFDHTGTLAHLDAAKLYTVEDVEERAERLRIATYRIFLAAGLPSTKASELVEAIYQFKLNGKVA